MIFGKAENFFLKAQNFFLHFYFIDNSKLRLEVNDLPEWAEL